MDPTRRDRHPTEAWGQTPPPVGAPAPGPRESWGPPPTVESGALVVIRQFDVANEIDLERVRALVPAERKGPARPRANAVVLSNPPVVLRLGVLPVTLGGETFQAETTARVFDFGAVSLRLRVPLAPGTTWSRLGQLSRDAVTDESITATCRTEVKVLCDRIAGAVREPHDAQVFEDYAVVAVERFSPHVAVDALPPDAVARLILGERDDAVLADAEIEAAVDSRTSYYRDDLCVAGWNVALVVEPAGDTDPVDVLEFANAQLLELRFHDALLDRQLDRLYDEVASRRGRSLALTRNYGPVLRSAMSTLMDLSEFVERVENAIKIVGDVYLARVYANAVDALRIPAWERTVTRKQQLVREVYDVLKSDVDAARGQTLELTVIALIAFEILLAFWRH